MIYYNILLLQNILMIFTDNLSFFNRPEIKIHRYNKDLIDLFYGKGIKSGINSVALGQI